MQGYTNIIKATVCCGVRFLYEIAGKDTDRIVFTVANRIANGTRNDGTKAAHYIWTDNTGNNGSYGDNLKDFIIVNNLGEVTATDWRVNPNSGNQLKLYTWTPDEEAMLAFYQANTGPTTEEVLSELGLGIGDYVRCRAASPFMFEGRMLIDSIRGDDVVLLDIGGAERIMPVQYLNTLTKTRPFVANN